MKNQQVAIRLPKIYSANGDTSKKWFVFFWVINPLTNKLERVRVMRDINSFDDADERMKRCIELAKEINKKLLTGWNPLNIEATDSIVYRDSLAYKSIEKLDGGIKKSTRGVNYYLSEYINYVSKRVKDSSLASYKSKLRIFDAWITSKGYGDYDVSAIGTRIIIAFFNYLVENRDLSQGTIDKYRRHLSDFFKYLEGLKKIKEVPSIEMPRIGKIVDQAPRPINAAYMDRLKELLKNDQQLWLVSQFEYYCAIRPCEFRFMKIKDIDLIGGLVRVSNMWSKNEKTEVIKIPQQMIKAIEEQYNISELDPEFYLIGSGGCPSDKMIGKNTLRVRFNKIRDKLGLPKDIKLYSFKHTAAVKLGNSNMPIKQVQKHFRHSKLDTTDVYMRKMAAYENNQIKDEFPDL